MALISIQKPTDDVKIGLWKIEESVDDFFNKYPFLVDYKLDVSSIKSEARKLEFLAVRVLLYEMTKDTFLVIQHEKSGRPILRGYNISISHTKGYAAIILSEDKEVGIDIEYISDRVDKIASRFLRADEEYTTTQQRLIAWSIKETFYKLFSSDELQFSDIRTFKIKEGFSMVINYKRNVSLPVQYIINEDFVLTFAFT